MHSSDQPVKNAVILYAVTTRLCHCFYIKTALFQMTPCVYYQKKSPTVKSVLVQSTVFWTSNSLQIHLEWINLSTPRWQFRDWLWLVVLISFYPVCEKYTILYSSTTVHVYILKSLSWNKSSIFPVTLHLQPIYSPIKCIGNISSLLQGFPSVAYIACGLVNITSLFNLSFFPQTLWIIYTIK